MTEEEFHQRQRTEEELHLRHLYKQTQNPLYVWQAIAAARKADAPIPDWCAPYLREVAVNLIELASSVRDDRRDRDDPEDSSASEALRSVGAQTLSLSRQGKNQFAAWATDRRNMAYAKQFAFLNFSGEYIEKLAKSKDPEDVSLFAARYPGSIAPRATDYRNQVWDRIKQELSVERDRAQRIISDGLKLLRWRR
jgi:hypothetical protein